LLRVIEAAAAEAGPDAAQAQWVVFRCDGRRFGVPLGQVAEIVAARPFTRLPGAGSEVCGLVGVRGRVVTVLDLGVALGRRAAGSLPDHRLLLLDDDGRLIGAAVDDIVEIATARAERVGADRETPAGVAPPHGLTADMVLGTGRSLEGAFTIINVAPLIERLLQS
jgi:purine-binding chemotaxis protein CheW